MRAGRANIARSDKCDFLSGHFSLQIKRGDPRRPKSLAYSRKFVNQSVLTMMNVHRRAGHRTRPYLAVILGEVNRALAII